MSVASGRGSLVLSVRPNSAVKFFTRKASRALRTKKGEEAWDRLATPSRAFRAHDMTDDGFEAALATWAARHLPARLSAGEAAKLLGFAERDIQILMGTGKLTPLVDPAPNAPKWFAAIEMIEFAADRDWLNRATREVSKYWRQKRDRLSNHGEAARGACV